MKILQDGDEIRCLIQFNPYEEVRQAFDKQLRKIEAQALEDELAAHGYVKERTCSPKFFDNLRETNGAGDAWAVCSECGWLLCVLTEKQEWPRYCPGCGAKVVSE